MGEMMQWVPVVLLASGLAQSLGEIAEKERERREQTKSESAPVVGDRELARARGDGLSVTGKGVEPASMGSEGSDLEDPVDLDVPEVIELSPREVKELRETWNRVWKARLEVAQEQRDVAADAVYQCQKAGVFFFVPLGIDCEGVRERLAIAEYRVKEIRANRFNWELLLPERRRPPPRPE